MTFGDTQVLRLNVWGGHFLSAAFDLRSHANCHGDRFYRHLFFFPLSMWTLGAAKASGNSSVTTQPIRTLTTSAGRKQARHVPPRWRTLG